MALACPAHTRYGRVIHEFDPWFNFRATQYLVDNGYDKFSTWCVQMMLDADVIVAGVHLSRRRPARVARRGTAAP